MSKLIDIVAQYNLDDDWCMKWIDDSKPLGILGYEAGDAVWDNDDLKARIAALGYGPDDIRAATMLQAMAFVRFLDVEGNKDHLQTALAQDKMGPVFVTIIGWATLAYMTLDMNEWYLSMAEDLLPDDDEWIRGYAEVVGYHGLQFYTKYPEELTAKD